MNSEQFKEVQGLVQVGFFDLEPVTGNGTDETIISAEWASISDDDFEQVATERHRTLDQQEAVIDAFKNLIINAKGELYIAAKARLEHGKYLELLTKMGVEPRTAQYYSKLARDHREELLNAKRVSHLSLRQWIKISQSPESHQIIAKIEAGKLETDPKTINAELEAVKQRAKDAEEKLAAKEREHSLFKNDVEFNSRVKEQAYVALKQKVTELENREPVTVYIDTEETAAKVCALQEQIRELEDKPNIPPSVEQELATLKLDLNNAQIQLDFYTKQNEALAAKNNQLSEESRRSFVDNITAVGQLRIRQEWQAATSVLQASHSAFHLKIPSQIDRESFEGEEHTRTAQTIEVLEQTIALLKNTLPHSGDVIEQAGIVDAELFPMAIIHEAGKPVIGIPTEYQALFDKYRQAALAHPNPTLLWKAHGYPLHMMEREKHIQFTKELLSSEVDRRVKAAIEAMKRTLGTWEG